MVMMNENGTPKTSQDIMNLWAGIHRGEQITVKVENEEPMILTVVNVAHLTHSLHRVTLVAPCGRKLETVLDN